MSSGLPRLLLRVNGRNTGTFFVHGFDNAVVGSGAAVANALRSKRIFAPGGCGTIDLDVPEPGLIRCVIGGYLGCFFLVRGHSQLPHGARG
jgi:hypothetical protein